jgi:hypothetical protein
MKFTLPALIERQQTRAACDFLLEIELITIANALRSPSGGSESGQQTKIYTKSTLKSGDLGGFDGQVSSEYSPARRFAVFSKARGVIIDARSYCAQR